MASTTRNLVRFSDTLRDKVRREIRGAQAAEVVSYDADTQQAVIRFPQPVPVLTVDEDGEEQTTWRAQPTMDGVPVMFPGTAQGSLTFPVPAGARGLFVPFESDHASYLVTGTAPTALRGDDRHTLGCGGVFVPGAMVGTLPAAPEATVLAGADVRLGSETATEAMARADRAEAQLRALADRLYFLESWANQFASYLQSLHLTAAAAGAPVGVPLVAVPPLWAPGTPLVGVPVADWLSWDDPRPWAPLQGDTPAGYAGTGNTGADQVKGV